RDFHVTGVQTCALPIWTFELIQRYDEAIGETAREFGLDTYPSQIEIITSEQMLDAYASVGLPIGYPHWSYGKEFIRNEQAYRREIGRACVGKGGVCGGA